MPAFRPLCSVLADFIGEFPYPRPNESQTTNHEILLYYLHRKSRRKCRHRLKQTETRRGTLRGRSFRYVIKMYMMHIGECRAMTYVRIIVFGLP